MKKANNYHANPDSTLPSFRLPRNFVQFQRGATPEATPVASALALDRISLIIIRYWQSRALAVAAVFELVDVLDDGTLSVDAFASTTKKDPASLSRGLRVIESIGAFKQVWPCTFANTLMSECIRMGNASSQWALTRLSLSQGEGPFEAWTDLKESIRTVQTAFDRTFDRIWFRGLSV